MNIWRRILWVLGAEYVLVRDTENQWGIERARKIAGRWYYRLECKRGHRHVPILECTRNKEIAPPPPDRVMHSSDRHYGSWMPITSRLAAEVTMRDE